MSDPLRTYAEAVLRVLDLQQEYFRTRSPYTLEQCKTAERELRKRTVEIVSGAGAGTPSRGLFPRAEGTAYDGER